MTDNNQKNLETSENLQKSVMTIMYTMRQKYSKYAEYKTIMMNLTTVSKEINSIRLKEIVGEMDETTKKS